MANSGDKERYLKLECTADEGDDTVVVDAIEFFRSYQDYLGDTNAYTVSYTGGTAAAEPIVVMSEVLPPPTHIALEVTFQA